MKENSRRWEPLWLMLRRHGGRLAWHRVLSLWWCWTKTLAILLILRTEWSY